MKILLSHQLVIFIVNGKKTKVQYPKEPSSFVNLKIIYVLDVLRYFCCSLSPQSKPHAPTALRSSNPSPTRSLILLRPLPWIIWAINTTLLSANAVVSNKNDVIKTMIIAVNGLFFNFRHEYLIEQKQFALKIYNYWKREELFSGGGENSYM